MLYINSTLAMDNFYGRARKAMWMQAVEGERFNTYAAQRILVWSVRYIA